MGLERPVPSPCTLPWRAFNNGLDLTVRLQPGAKRDRLDGIIDLPDGNTALRVAVRARAVDGAANDGLRDLLADLLDCAPRDIRLVAGERQRLKRLRIEGDAEVIARRLLGML